MLTKFRIKAHIVLLALLKTSPLRLTASLPKLSSFSPVFLFHFLTILLPEALSYSILITYETMLEPQVQVPTITGICLQDVLLLGQKQMTVSKNFNIRKK